MQVVVRIAFAGVLALGGGLRAVPQQAVPPPPNPADSSPTLAVTMQFIQDKLSGIGDISYTQQAQADGSSHTFHLRLSVTDASSCMLGTTVTDLDSRPFFTTTTVPLKDVETIGVSRLGSDPQTVASGFTYPGPPVFALILSVPKYTVSNARVWISDNKKHTRNENPYKGNAASYLFTEEDLANRVAKAMLHAVELCSAAAPTNAKKPNEPF